jgi:hypothetical protein
MCASGMGFRRGHRWRRCGRQPATSDSIGAYSDLPTDRHPPLLRYLHRLRSAVTASIDPRDAGRWLTGDRQGLGGSRPGSALDGPVRLTVPGEDLADRHDQ